MFEIGASHMSNWHLPAVASMRCLQMLLTAYWQFTAPRGVWSAIICHCVDGRRQRYRYYLGDTTTSIWPILYYYRGVREHNELIMTSRPATCRASWQIRKIRRRIHAYKSLFTKWCTSETVARKNMNLNEQRQQIWWTQGQVQDFRRGFFSGKNMASAERKPIMGVLWSFAPSRVQRGRTPGQGVKGRSLPLKLKAF